MKYFTVELLNRFRSDDEDVSARAHDDWEDALKRYQRREARIKAALPAGVRRFLDEHVCLHDARLFHMGTQGDTFVMILEMESPPRDLVILMFTLNGELQITDTPSKGNSTSDLPTWMYEEWDIDRRQNCGFAVLLSNGWMVKAPFREFRYLIVQRLIPSRTRRAAISSSRPIPQPA